MPSDSLVADSRKSDYSAIVERIKFASAIGFRNGQGNRNGLRREGA